MAFSSLALIFEIGFDVRRSCLKVALSSKMSNGSLQADYIELTSPGRNSKTFEISGSLGIVFIKDNLLFV